MEVKGSAGVPVEYAKRMMFPVITLPRTATEQDKVDALKIASEISEGVINNHVGMGLTLPHG